jgi:anti-sigma B factor antagonist
MLKCFDCQAKAAYLEGIKQMIQEITIQEGHFLVNLSGSICVAEAAHLRESINIFLHNGHKNFVLDFGDVNYIDNAGLGTLLYIRKRVLEGGGSVIIRGLQGIVKDLFEFTQLTRVFEIQ